jgi:hypothetical protein
MAGREHSSAYAALKPSGKRALHGADERADRHGATVTLSAARGMLQARTSATSPDGGSTRGGRWYASSVAKLMARATRMPIAQANAL